MHPVAVACGGPVSDEELLRRLQSHVDSILKPPPVLDRLVRFPSGFSWTTYALTATRGPGDATEWILRTGNPNGLLAPYSIVPEATVYQELSGTGIPVPSLVLASDDASVLGAPFLVCSRIAGTTPLPWRGEGGIIDHPRRLAIAGEFVTLLARIHGFDWRGSGFGPGHAHVTAENAAALQVERWAGLVAGKALRPIPALKLAEHWLRQNAPTASRVALVHGDYRVGNFLLDQGSISAILDWELVHVGDPHEDLGWAYLKNFRAGTDRVCGLVGEDEFRRLYEGAGGVRIDMDVVRYYQVLAMFKMVAINLGATWLVERGLADDLRLATMGFGLPGLMNELQRLLELAR